MARKQSQLTEIKNEIVETPETGMEWSEVNVETFELKSVEFYQSEMNKIADDASKREEFFALKKLRNLALKKLNNL